MTATTPSTITTSLSRALIDPLPGIREWRRASRGRRARAEVGAAEEAAGVAPGAKAPAAALGPAKDSVMANWGCWAGSPHPPALEPELAARRPSRRRRG